MLKADLNFYPDARFATGSRLGMILLLHRDSRSYVGFIPAKGFEAATIDVDDPVLRNIFQDVAPFLVRLGSANHDSEVAMANGIAAGLPHNLRMTDPEKWPPGKIDALIISAADESNEIQLYSVA